jgi:uncharacterized iron-regulated membrane protein
MHQQTEHLASRTRTYRRLHRFVAVPLFAFMFLIGLSGVLLGWKRQTGLAPITQTALSTNPSNWISIDSLQKIAISQASLLQLDTQIERIDIRPDKGTAKVIFVKHYTELQLDCTTGKLLSKEKRLHDFVEHLHDGTIVDRLLGTKHEQVKISYTTLTSTALMLLAFSGFWMWFNPRRMRRIKSSEQT